MTLHEVGGSLNRTTIESYRVLVVDDHAMFAEAVSQAVGAEPDLEMVGTATSLSEAEVILTNSAVHAVIVDSDLAGESGIDLLRSWSAKNPDLVFVLLVSNVRRKNILEILEAGAVAVISKSRPASDLVDALRAGRNGRTSVLLEAPIDRSETPDVGLTDREVAIIRLLAEGRTDGDIGEFLCISRNTVRTHVRRAFAKLGASSRLEAVAIARKQRVI